MLQVKNLSKTYGAFNLSAISFSIEKGYIVGFIGANGAGKTTCLKSILNIALPDSGTVEFFGKNIKDCEAEIKEDLGIMFGGAEFYPRMRAKKLAAVYKRFYKHWDEARFNSLLKRFNIDLNKKMNELSAGMKSKFNIALALSHDAKLLMLDEPTSGLDPLARDELLDIFREIVESGEKSVLFSTHITSDLEKCADYILFIKDGLLLASDTRDGLIDKHALIKGTLAEFTDDLKSRLISYKKSAYGFSALALKESLKDYGYLLIEQPTLEDLMIYYNKEAAL